MDYLQIHFGIKQVFANKKNPYLMKDQKIVLAKRKINTLLFSQNLQNRATFFLKAKDFG